MEERSRIQLPPGVGDRYEVYVNGVRQEPGRDFDRLGDTLWFRARPRGDAKWKLTAASALASGALAYLFNQMIHIAWDRPRPYESHAGVFHPHAHSTDASFPSDHASAAFGIAFAVFMFDRVAGSIF